ncbi:MAG: hypothetical protein AAFQ58_08525 [Pseudomonadota bacterium]
MFTWIDTGDLTALNNDHGSTSDIWRIRTDGTDLRQMTTDAPVNRFPHPSPDVSHVLYRPIPKMSGAIPGARM